MKHPEISTIILAVALALFLWIYVRTLQRAPEVRRVIPDVPVFVEGSAPGWAPILMDTSVTVKLRGPAEQVNNLLRDDLRATVDVSAVKSTQTRHIRVKIERPTGVELVGKEPEVMVTAIPLGQKAFPVSVAFVTTPAPGTTVGQYLVEPESVVVEGAESILSKVKYVNVTVDPKESFTSWRTVVPRAVDAGGELVADVRVLTSSVRLRMATLTGPKVTRKVAVRTPKILNPPRGVNVIVDKIRPDVVTLSGEAALLDLQPAFVETDPIDARGLVKDTTRTVHLRVPRGLTIVEGNDVRVDLVVQREGVGR